MTDAQSLRGAIESGHACKLRGEGLAALLADLEARRVVAVDVERATLAAYDDAASDEVLGAATPDDVQLARVAHVSASDNVRALELAIVKVRARTEQHATERADTLANLSAAMSVLAAQQIDQWRDAVARHAHGLGHALRTLHCLDECTRGVGTGFLTGQTAEKIANNPGEILRGYGFDASLLVMLRERHDSFTASELLALVTE